MDSGWAQAILSALAIIASGAFAVWVPYHERRVEKRRTNQARLAITTVFHPPAGLAVEFSYMPEFWHVGVTAHVEVLSPKLVELTPSRFVSDPAITETGMHGRMEPAGFFQSNKGVVRLYEASDYDALVGLLYLFPVRQEGRPVEPLSLARIRVEIVTDAKEHLLMRTFTVSPINPPSAI